MHQMNASEDPLVGGDLAESVSKPCDKLCLNRPNL